MNRHPHRRRHAFCSLLAAPLVTAVFAAATFGILSVDGQVPDEYLVKAAFLFNFGRFVEWPQENGSANSTVFRICVLGEDPFRDDLKRSTQNRLMKGREIAVLLVNRAEEARGCQILFVSASERRTVRDVLDTLKGFSVLTVADMDGFAEAGGMIHFTLEDGRVRFEVNVTAAEHAGLRISSHLLNLARIARSG